MIYVVEDDASIRELVAYALSQAELENMCFSSGREFFALFDAARARLIVLDIMLPGEDGLSILSRLRQKAETAHIPVIIMSALGAEMDKVRGLDLGADDYIAKPFGVMEFLARVRAQLRRGAASESLAVGDIRLWPEARRVEAAGESVSLTAKEFDLLQYLLMHSDRAVRREELLGAVWGYTGGEETRTVDVHIRSLRAKLGEAGAVIATVRSIGYRAEGKA